MHIPKGSPRRGTDVGQEPRKWGGGFSKRMSLFGTLPMKAFFPSQGKLGGKEIPF